MTFLDDRTSVSSPQGEERPRSASPRMQSTDGGYVGAPPGAAAAAGATGAENVEGTAAEAGTARTTASDTRTRADGSRVGDGGCGGRRCQRCRQPTFPGISSTGQPEGRCR